MDGAFTLTETGSAQPSHWASTGSNCQCKGSGSRSLATLATHSNAPNANWSVKTKPTKFNWTQLVALLRKVPADLNALEAHFELLSVSPTRLARARNVDPRFRALVADYGTQNCIRAVSVLRDYSHIKKNQYKWMYEGLTLGAAVDSLIRESRYLFKSLVKQDGEMQHFLRLLNNWIDYLSEIHKVPKDAEAQLRFLITERVGLFLNLALV